MQLMQASLRPTQANYAGFHSIYVDRPWLSMPTPSKKHSKRVLGSNRTRPPARWGLHSTRMTASVCMLKVCSAGGLAPPSCRVSHTFIVPSAAPAAHNTALHICLLHICLLRDDALHCTPSAHDLRDLHRHNLCKIILPLINISRDKTS